jgi:hypothetical protein
MGTWGVGDSIFLLKVYKSWHILSLESLFSSCPPLPVQCLGMTFQRMSMAGKVTLTPLEQDEKNTTKQSNVLTNVSDFCLFSSYNFSLALFLYIRFKIFNHDINFLGFLENKRKF